MKPYDFRGTATKYGVKCRDGRTILPGSFKHQDGVSIPLLWQHQHQSLDNVLGHGILRHEDNRVVVEAKFNETDQGKNAKKLVHNGDLKYLSIWANDVVEEDGIVSHGNIREVSIVLSGANPGAIINNVVAHSDDPFTQEQIVADVVIIHSGEEIQLVEEKTEEVEDSESSEEEVEDENTDVDSNEEEETEEEQEDSDETIQHSDRTSVAEILKTFNEEQQIILGSVVAHGLNVSKITDETYSDDSGKSYNLSDIWEGLTEEQQSAVYSVAEQLLDGPQLQQSNEDNEMSSNIFEKDGAKGVISHADQAAIMGTLITGKVPSVKASILEHAGTYGVDNISALFPEVQNVKTGGPHIYSEDMAWVEKTLGKTRKTPFARIKSTYADITADEARAKGYVTGAEKTDEVFPILARETTPQTIYKKQKLDRDDVVDITSFDMIAWLKTEMRMKLKEELARAILIGDGRANAHADKIKPANIRPIYGDDAIYAHPVEFAQAATVLEIIDGITAARKHYKGSGNPVFYCTTDILTSMLLVRDANDHRLYKTEMELAAALRVSSIVEVPPMDTATREDGADTINLLGIVVNLRDYVIGADKGGQTAFFEDFDIDFNQMKYLYETRVSGALVVPKAALVIEQNIDA